MFTILRSSITMEITLVGLRGPRDVYNPRSSITMEITLVGLRGLRDVYHPEVINHIGDHVGWTGMPSRY